MTPAQSTEALRRETLVLRARSLMDAPCWLSLNAAAREMGAPVSSLHGYLRRYDGSLESLAPKQAGRSGVKSLRSRFVAQLGEASVVEVEKKVAGLALDLSPSIAGGSRRLSDGLAWRTFARRAECPRVIRDYFAEPRRSKHSIAASLHQNTRPGPLVDALHRGRRCYSLAGPYQPRKLDILGGDAFSSDDTTPIYGWWVPWPHSPKYPHGAKLLQGQWLPVICVASQHILCYALIAREQSSYRAADIWRLMGRVHSLVGLPRLGWQKERGSWEANLIDGVKIEPEPGEPGHAQRVGGLRMLPANILRWHRERLGDERADAWTKLKTWTSYLPKSKSIEGVFNRLQRLEGCLWGCLGRSQQRRPYERAIKVYNAGRADPRLHFLSGPELMQRLNACIEAHEAEPIEGEVFKGRPAETWERGIAEHGELLPEPPQGRWLYTSDWALVKAARGMVRIRRTDEVTDEPVSYHYTSPHFAGAMDGRKLLVYFNRDAYREPAHVLLPRANGAHEYLGTADYIERVGAFLDTDRTGYERRNEQAGLVATLYSDLARNIPSRQLPAEIAERRRLHTIELRHNVPILPPVISHRTESTERVSKTRPTGIPGIAFFETASNRRDGTVQAFLSTYTRTPDGRRKCSRFCISTLGYSEALRRAVAARGTYERTLKGRTRAEIRTVSTSASEV